MSHANAIQNEICWNTVRSDFPQLAKTKVHGKPLIYLDSAATTLKPQSVIDTIHHHYQEETSNIHRGVHYLSEHGTNLYENTRARIADFINAPDKSQILYTKGTTDSLNLVALSYGRSFLKAGDEIIISEMEHHSNIVPWQILCESNDCVLKVAPINDKGELILEEYEKLLSEKTKLVSMVYVSNSLGTINPIKEVISLAKKYQAVTVVDAAQAVAHLPVDVQDLDCDFLAFSGHKIFGPTGVGVLYGKKELLNRMPPLQGGGDMIDVVTFEKTTYNVIPHKFEAGTPHIAGVIGLDPAIEYVQNLGLSHISNYEHELLEYGNTRLLEVEGLKLIGTAKNKGAVLSFVIDGAHPHDIGTLVDMAGVAIRTGHHCTQPLMKRLGINATCRASLSIYNNKHDIDELVKALKKAKDML